MQHVYIFYYCIYSWGVMWLICAHPPHKAAGTLWRSEGCPWSQPCSRRLPGALASGFAGWSPWWDHMPSGSYLLWFPPGGPLCAGMSWPVARSHGREPRQAGLGVDTQSQSAWWMERRGCLCLFGEKVIDIFVKNLPIPATIGREASYTLVRSPIWCRANTEIQMLLH